MKKITKAVIPAAGNPPLQNSLRDCGMWTAAVFLSAAWIFAK